MTACLTSDEGVTSLRGDEWSEETNTAGEPPRAALRVIGHSGRPLPLLAIRRYADRATRAHTTAKQYADGSWWVTAPDLPGTFGEGQTLDEAYQELGGVIVEWVVAKIEDGDRDLPIIEGTFDLNTV